MPAWGRGGAGNIGYDEQLKQERERKSQDIEAQTASSSITSTSPPAHTTPFRPADQYAHSGRGGAGNWYQPSALAQTGTFTSSTPSDTTTTSSSSSSSSSSSPPKLDDATAAPDAQCKPLRSSPWEGLSVARSGRGGAGNFYWGAQGEGEEDERREKEKEEEVKRRVERDVEGGLKRPGGAVLGGRRRGQ
ncbi:hypothetical protein M011DRAFT_479569 [Sporormia fimetaria CBS 119925]|uniref:Uncharacterized protein n=1 Tax=Sporormia fimetaria CBS 119925 TaxID=1340428 RepID=A0A6A6V2L3_9PLEO|nr:hypothetical protein M011DRAFT_479569 [Sporormia fimetaria CBS 119925]